MTTLKPARRVTTKPSVSHGFFEQVQTFDMRYWERPGVPFDEPAIAALRLTEEEVRSISQRGA
jgi:hypothetical protein